MQLEGTDWSKEVRLLQSGRERATPAEDLNSVILYGGFGGGLGQDLWTRKWTDGEDATVTATSTSGGAATSSSSEGSYFLHCVPLSRSGKLKTLSGFQAVKGVFSS
ncbi:unnamed protein product [Calypogeia fissa]